MQSRAAAMRCTVAHPFVEVSTTGTEDNTHRVTMNSCKQHPRDPCMRNNPPSFALSALQGTTWQMHNHRRNSIAAINTRHTCGTVLQASGPSHVQRCSPHTGGTGHCLAAPCPGPRPCPAHAGPARAVPVPGRLCPGQHLGALPLVGDPQGPAAHRQAPAGRQHSSFHSHHNSMYTGQGMIQNFVLAHVLYSLHNLS